MFSLEYLQTAESTLRTIVGKDCFDKIEPLIDEFRESTRRLTQ